MLCLLRLCCCSLWHEPYHLRKIWEIPNHRLWSRFPPMTFLIVAALVAQTPGNEAHDKELSQKRRP